MVEKSVEIIDPTPTDLGGLGLVPAEDVRKQSDPNCMK